MTIKIMNGDTVEGSGDSIEEAIWDLKRNRPEDREFVYPVNPDGPIVGVNVRTGEDHMEVLEMTLVDTTEASDEV